MNVLVYQLKREGLTEAGYLLNGSETCQGLFQHAALRQGELFQRIDSNQDGELSRSELQAGTGHGHNGHLEIRVKYRETIMPKSRALYLNISMLAHHPNFFWMLDASKLQKSTADPEASLRKLGVSLSTSELDGILRIFDSDGSGSIDPCARY